MIIRFKGLPFSKPLLETQGDRTILTRLLILSHSAFSAAPTMTPHERRRAYPHPMSAANGRTSERTCLPQRQRLRP